MGSIRVKSTPAGGAPSVVEVRTVTGNEGWRIAEMFEQRFEKPMLELEDRRFQLVLADDRRRRAQSDSPPDLTNGA